MLILEHQQVKFLILNQTKEELICNANKLLFTNKIVKKKT